MAGLFGCHRVGLDKQLRTIYNVVLSMGVAHGYYGVAYPAGECVDVLCSVSCTARRVEKKVVRAGSGRDFHAAKHLDGFRCFIFSFCLSDLFA